MIVAADSDLTVQNVLSQRICLYGVAYTVACGLGFFAVRLFAGLAVLRRGLIVGLSIVSAVRGIGRLGDRRIAGLLCIRADRFRLQREDQHERRTEQTLVQHERCGDHNGCAADDPRQRGFFLCGFFYVQRFLRSGILAGDGKGNFLAGLHFVLLRRQVGLIVHVCHCLPYCWCPLSIPHEHAVCNRGRGVQF